MKALSLWQPWASLWACGRKTYETRDWSTSYRGQLLVHAAKRLILDVSDELREILEDECGGHWMRDLPAGALIAQCELADCLPTEHVHVDADERAQGNFTRGRYAWSPMNMRPLDRPIPWRGQMGLFNVDILDLALADLLEEPAAPSPQGRLL